MGFRGEALASIASVSHVELKTKRPEDRMGTLIYIEGSDVKKQEPIAFQNGTSIVVKNLFYNIPARRNFLKSNPVETRHILDEFTRVALANPEIAFNMHHNDAEVYTLKKSDISGRICAIFNLSSTTDLLAAEEQTTIMNVSGFIGSPQLAKKTRGDQYLFVNKRFIKDAYLNHAIVNTYEHLLSREQFPLYVLHLDINPSMIDVNIHPSKTEIKFEDEKSVYHILRAVCKRALGQHFHVPTFEPASDDTFLNLRPPLTQNDNRPIKEVFEKQSPQPANRFNSPTQKEWKELFDIIHTPSSKENTLIPDVSREENITPPQNNLLQFAQSYIVSQLPSGLLIIDQQAAHERILFEKYQQAIELFPISSQQILFPKSITLTPADSGIIQEIQPELASLGFDVSSLGQHTFVINGIPADLPQTDERELIESLLENFKQEGSAMAKKAETIAKALAVKASIKRGQKLSPQEMMELIDSLFACKNTEYSPSGKKCVARISIADIVSLFEKK
jgi:DNA mismatch repair protein MutL